MVEKRVSERKSTRGSRASPALRGGFRVALIVVGMLALGLVGVTLKVNRSFPDPPELRKVSLELPKRAVSKALSALLDVRAKNGFPTPRVPALRAGRKTVEAGRWLAHPKAVLAAIGRLNRPSLAAFHAAMAAPGCLPREGGVGPSRYSYLVLIRGIRLAAVEAIALAQTARAGDAVARLASLQTRLLKMRRCSGTLVGVMVLDAGLRALLPTWGFLLARLPAELSPRQRQTVWASIKALEVIPRGVLADALRHEHAYLAAGLRKLPEQEQEALRGKALQGRGRTKNPRVTATKRLSWPWFDLEDTLRMQRVLSKRRVWLAMKPSTDPAWKKRYPEQQYFTEIRASRLLAMFRYNHMGKVLVSFSGPDYQKYSLRLDQTACLAAAHRARWTAELRRRARILPTEATTPPPRDPLTKKPFPTVAAGVYCSVGGLPGSPVLALPVLPRPTSAPAPGPEPKGSKS